MRDRKNQVMEDRPYDTLSYFPREADATEIHAAEAKEAVRLAHGAEIKQIKQFLENSQSVLVTGDKTLTPYLLDSLKQQFGNAARFPEVILNRPDPQNRGPGNTVSQLVQVLVERLGSINLTEAPHTYLVVRHLDLMTWTAADHPGTYFNDVLYWLTEFGHVVKLAFWDPQYPLPKAIENLFPNRVSVQLLRREVLWQLVGGQEARKLSRDRKAFTLAAQLRLYHYVSGTNVVDVRRILRGLVQEKAFINCDDEGNPDPAFDFIHRQTSPQVVQPTSAWGQVTGYGSLQEELRRTVIFPVELRHEAKNESELEQADALIPRGVILHGPPGTGKTEWGKWLARELKATLLIIHGPELKHQLVGETERAIRRIFARARRDAPSLILIDELDAITPRRDQGASNFEASMVAQLLTEIDGLHTDEAVLIVGTTNLLESLDPAFLRPGRFGVPILVDYPQGEDRLAILKYYADKFHLPLTEGSITRLVEETGGVLDPERTTNLERYHAAVVKHLVKREFYAEAGPIAEQRVRDRCGLTQLGRFSGDHLRAICLYLLREGLYRKTQGWNDATLLKAAVESVRKRHVGSCLPTAEAPEVRLDGEFF